MHVQLISTTQRNGVSAATQRPWACLEIQGVLHNDDGSQHVFVYDFWPAKGEPLPELAAGTYSVVTELRPDNKTRKLMANIVRLIPVQVRAANTAQPKAA